MRKIVEKLLGTIFNDRLKFLYNIENLCKKGNLKLSGLSRVAPFVDLPQKKTLLKPFFIHSLATVHWFGCAIEYSITK